MSNHITKMKCRSQSETERRSFPHPSLPHLQGVPSGARRARIEAPIGVSPGSFSGTRSCAPALLRSLSPSVCVCGGSRRRH
ncbi:hypothetical protein NL676_017894 [Syzygium grande]|nr:hypothetical protein NL676_017894 [Syzygium grande]